MSGVNKVILVGRLGQDPELRAMPSGDQVVNLRVATSDTWKDKTTGESKERTEWHRVVIFGKLAEIAGQYLRKGSQVYLEGRIQTRKWQDSSGQDRYSTEVVLRGYDGTMQMLGGTRDGDVRHQATAPTQNNPNASVAAQAPPASADFDDDVPF